MYNGPFPLSVGAPILKNNPGRDPGYHHRHSYGRGSAGSYTQPELTHPASPEANRMRDARNDFNVAMWIGAAVAMVGGVAGKYLAKAVVRQKSPGWRRFQTGSIISGGVALAIWGSIAILDALADTTPEADRWHPD